MGQYYRPVLVDKNGKIKVYNRNIGKEYTMAKLMEHSWINNPMVNLICKELYKKPHMVFWVGDYAEKEDLPEGREDDFDLIKDAWEVEGLDLKKPSFPFHPYDLLLVNHTKKCYICFDDYIFNVRKQTKEQDGWVAHPLPLLTAVGNGKGGGDFDKDSEGYGDIGIWAGDIISVEPWSEKIYKNLADVSKDIVFIEK